MVVRGWGKGRLMSDYLMGVGFPFGVMKIFWNLIEVVVAQHYECTKCH